MEDIELEQPIMDVHESQETAYEQNLYQTILPKSQKRKRNLESPLSQESSAMFPAVSTPIQSKNRYTALPNVQQANPSSFLKQETHPQLHTSFHSSYTW